MYSTNNKCPPWVANRSDHYLYCTSFPKSFEEILLTENKARKNQGERDVDNSKILDKLYIKMVMDQNNKNSLSSWKEIAAYLNCSVRTCTRWEEKYHLPIHRIDRESGTTVYAYKNELDRWIAGRVKKKSRFLDIISFRLNIPNIVLLVFFITAVFFSIFFIPKIFTDRIPSGFHIENSTLYVLNKDGKKLWEYDSKIENLISEKIYRVHYQYKKERPNNSFRQILPYLIIKDIDSDGKDEVLFSIQTQDNFGEGRLMCFNFLGDQLWSYSVGNEIKFGENVYSNDFRISGFEIHDLNENGKDEVIIISYHVYDWPCQIVILNKEGKEMGKYWNTGYFTDFEVVDLDNDGTKELIFVGVNNEFGKGCVTVFKSDNLKGYSPQLREEFKSEEYEAGSEIFYILIPRTDVDLLDKTLNSLVSVKILKNNRIAVITAFTNILYEFNFNLELENITLSNKFKELHRKARKEGKITYELAEEDYKKKLAEGLLYYDGNSWVSEPTMTAYWKNMSPEK